MENIGNFLAACETFGLTKQDLFQTVDLYEGVNIPQVRAECMPRINGFFSSVPNYFLLVFMYVAKAV